MVCHRLRTFLTTGSVEPSRHMFDSSKRQAVAVDLGFVLQVGLVAPPGSDRPFAWFLRRLPGSANVVLHIWLHMASC